MAWRSDRGHAGYGTRRPGQSCARRRRRCRGPDACRGAQSRAQGSVLATDISEDILGFAERAAADAGLANVATRTMDGEELDVEEGFFDAVISRVGFIYFPDQRAAFAGMRRALKPGGRL